jgi:hypothetical protein
MKGHVVARSLAVVLTVALTATQAAAQRRDTVAQSRGLAQVQDGGAHAAVFPITGTTSTGGRFLGTVKVRSFASAAGDQGATNNQVVARGIVTGTVLDAAGNPVGTLLKAHVKIPVTVSQGATAAAAPSGPAATRVSPRPDDIVLAQAESCGILHLEFGSITLDVLGLTITTSAISLDLTGETGGTDALGTLVCQILTALTNVANLIGLLNQLLGLLGGLGGLTS